MLARAQGAGKLIATDINPERLKLAEKFAPPELEQALYGKAENAFRNGTNAVRERGAVRIVPARVRQPTLEAPAHASTRL